MCELYILREGQVTSRLAIVLSMTLTHLWRSFRDDCYTFFCSVLYGILIASIAQLWQKNRASSAILRGWVILTLNFRLKAYVSHQYVWTVGGMVILQLCCWKFSQKETL